MSKPEDFKFDSRVRERMLRSRTLAVRDLDRHLEQLPDLEGEYELLNDTPQPAVTPPRDHVEEPLVFDGIRRLQSLSEPHSSLRSAPGSVAVTSVQQPPREPLTRSFGSVPEVSRGPSPALRSALMESEISGVGAGALSALGAMAPERSAAAFPVNMPVVPAPSSLVEGEPQTPVTLRSQLAPEALKEDAAEAEAEAEAEPEAGGVADWEAPYPDSEDMA